jgi:hypothetical protein
MTLRGRRGEREAWCSCWTGSRGKVLIVDEAFSFETFQPSIN